MYLCAKSDESLDSQRLAVQTYANGHNLDIVREFGDVVDSSKRVAERKGLADLIRVAKQGEGKGRTLLLWSFSRLTADSGEVRYLMARLRYCGLNIVAVTDEDPAPEFTLLFDSFYAWSRLREELIMDTKLGLARIAACGCLPSGFPPTGYRISHVTIEPLCDGTPREWQETRARS